MGHVVLCNDGHPSQRGCPTSTSESPQREKLSIRVRTWKSRSGKRPRVSSEIHTLSPPPWDSKQAAFNFYSSLARSNEINGIANTILLNEQTELLFHQERKRCFLVAACPLNNYQREAGSNAQRILFSLPKAHPFLSVCDI